MHPWIWIPGGPEDIPGRPAIGGKARALAMLRRIGGRSQPGPEVPPWFVVRTEAFTALAATEGAPGDARVGELRSALAQALAATGLAGGRLAVRSSAASEDGTAASFAGQFESVLDVPGDAGGDALWAAIRRVWASASSARATAYGAGHGGGTVVMAVIVQEMLAPLAAGVAFDADPVSGDRDTIVVSAVRGLGEALVSGEANADTFRLRATPGGWRVHERALACAAPAIDDAQAAEIAHRTRSISGALQRPQDIEWAVVGRPARVVILQTRPITTLADPVGAPADLPAEHRIWDNSNIVESYARVTTPLTFTFARAVYADAYRQFCSLMGVSAFAVAANGSMFENMLGLVRGRVYYQLLNWYRMLALLPGFTFNRGFMERMMGVREALPDAALGGARRGRSPLARLADLGRLVHMAARMAREAGRLAREVPAFHARLEAHVGPPERADLSRRSPAELVALYRELERELLAHWQPPLVNDFFAMIAFGVLCRLIERWLPAAPPTLANDLLCGEGDIISTEPARAVMGLARDAQADATLRAAFAAPRGDDAALWRGLHAPPTPPAFTQALDAYVARFGDRCMNELKLETVTLREDPSFLLELVRAYATGAAADPEAAVARERGIRAAAERQVAATLRGWRRALFGWVLVRARHRVRDRENLRFERTRVFGVVRRLALALGAHLAAAGRLAGPRDVFWLTLDELLGSPADDGADFRPRVAARRARFAAWSRAPAPPDRFTTDGAITDWLAHDPPGRAVAGEGGGARGGGGADTLHGLGCCPGVVRGTVRVVHDPTHAVDLVGRILVAERTDPGWTLLFPAVRGLLVQRGSLLSHSAIVAREMGIPCVVAIPDLLATLQDGDEVELDGASGEVRRLRARAGGAGETAGAAT